MQTVSVIIPSWNRPKELHRAIQSVLVQSLPVKEILVCDDGSTADTHGVVNSFNNHKVRWINCGRNGRPAIPRNKGISQSTGSWVAFLDDDDEWLPTKLAEQFSKLKAGENRASATNALRIKTNGSLGLFFDHPLSEFSWEDLLKENLVICSSIMVHRSILEKTKGFPEEEPLRALEDYALWLRVAEFTPVDYVDEPLVHYYDQPHSSIRKKKMNPWEQRRLVMQNYLDWMKTSGLRDISKHRILTTKEMKRARINKIKSVAKKVLTGR